MRTATQRGWHTAKTDTAQSISCLLLSPLQTPTQGLELLCSEPAQEEANGQKKSKSSFLGLIRPFGLSPGVPTPTGKLIKPYPQATPLLAHKKYQEGVVIT